MLQRDCLLIGGEDDVLKVGLHAAQSGDPLVGISASPSGWDSRADHDVHTACSVPDAYQLRNGRTMHGQVDAEVLSSAHLPQTLGHAWQEAPRLNAFTAVR